MTRTPVTQSHSFKIGKPLWEDPNGHLCSLELVYVSVLLIYCENSLMNFIAPDVLTETRYH